MIKGFFEQVPGLLDGSIETKIRDVSGVASNKVIRMSDQWKVEFKWTLTGPVIPFLGGNFELKVNVEPVGPGARRVAMTKTVPVTANKGFDRRMLSYSEEITIPGGQITEEGVYRVSKHLLYHGPFGGKVAAFTEGEDIEFY